MKKPTRRNASKQLAAKQQLSQQIQQWSIQRGLTTAERYALGPTDTWHTAGEYFLKVLPLWCPLSVAWQKEPALPPASSFFALARGGILDTSYVPMRNVWQGHRQPLYVRDSEKTRDVLSRLQSYPIAPLAWRFVKTRLVQDTFEEGWLAIFKQVVVLRRKLEKDDWVSQLDQTALNIQRHVKVGSLVDEGKMTPDLLIIALRLVTVWLQDYLREKHPGKGYVPLSPSGKLRQIKVIYGHRQLITHGQIRLSAFYRSNLYHAPARFSRTKRHP